MIIWRCLEKRTIPSFEELVDFLRWVVVGGVVNCWDVFFVVIEYIITESLGTMSVFVLIGYEIGPEMGLRIRIFSGFEHIQIVHGYSRKYCT